MLASSHLLWWNCIWFCWSSKDQWSWRGGLQSLSFCWNSNSPTVLPLDPWAGRNDFYSCHWQLHVNLTFPWTAHAALLLTTSAACRRRKWAWCKWGDSWCCTNRCIIHQWQKSTRLQDHKTQVTWINNLNKYLFQSSTPYKPSCKDYMALRTQLPWANSIVPTSAITTYGQFYKTLWDFPWWPVDQQTGSLHFGCSRFSSAH